MSASLRLKAVVNGDDRQGGAEAANRSTDQAAPGHAEILRIAAFNRGRLPPLLDRKYRSMAESALAYFRGTAHLFYEDLRNEQLPQGPLVWCSGDTHVENFGTHKSDNGLTYFDQNDFDEAALLPLTWDLARFATSVRVACAGRAKWRRDSGAYARAFLEAYRGALSEGRALWLERATAKGPVRALLRQVRGRGAGKLLAKRTTGHKGARRLKIDGERTLALSNAERRKALSLAASPPRDPRFDSLSAVDAGFRVAGLASLGLHRYIVLTRSRDQGRRFGVLDVKEARSSSAADAARCEQPRWRSEAERIVTIQLWVQAAPPALLADIAHGQSTYVLRELQPVEDRLDIAAIARRRPIFFEALESMARVVAWGHVRGAARHGSATVDELMAFARQRDWIRSMEKFAAHYGSKVVVDAKAFTRAVKQDAMPHVHS